MKYRCTCGEIFEGELPFCPKCGKKMNYAKKEEVVKPEIVEVEKVVEYATPINVKEELVVKPCYDFRVLSYGILLIIGSYIPFVISLLMGVYAFVYFSPIVLIIALIEGGMNYLILISLAYFFFILLMNVSCFVTSINGMKKGIQTIVNNSLPGNSVNTSFEMKEQFVRNKSDKYNLFGPLLVDVILLAVASLPWVGLDMNLVILFSVIALILTLIHAILNYVRKVLASEISL